jgi:outer membrane biosynthesis protein TonB
VSLTRMAVMRAVASCSVLLLAVSVLVGGVAEGTFAQARKSTRPTHGVCDREAEKILGRGAVRAGGNIRGLKKIRNVSPAYPPLPRGTTGRGMWIGDVLVDTKGRISRVWTIHEVEITPALPAFNTAITDAIRQWEFEPLQVNKAAVAVCLTVTININWS